jgi:hypothetical protein
VGRDVVVKDHFKKSDDVDAEGFGPSPKFEDWPNFDKSQRLQPQKPTKRLILSSACNDQTNWKNCDKSNDYLGFLKINLLLELFLICLKCPVDTVSEREVSHRLDHVQFEIKPNSQQDFGQIQQNCQYLQSEENASELHSESELDRNECQVVKAKEGDADVHKLVDLSAVVFGAQCFRHFILLFEMNTD